MMHFIKEPNRIFLNSADGKLLAEVTFPACAKDTVEITHTFVDDSLRGQGVAGKLMEAVAEHLRTENKKAHLTCSYAVKWFAAHPDNADVLLASDALF